MKKLVSLVLALAMLLSMTAALADTVGGMEDGWWKDIETFHLDAPLRPFRRMGMTVRRYPTREFWMSPDRFPPKFDGCYYLPTVEKSTPTFTCRWTGVLTPTGTPRSRPPLAGGVDNLPYLIRPGSYGVAALANEGAIIPLDDYLDLIPNIVAAVGEDRFAD